MTDRPETTPSAIAATVQDLRELAAVLARMNKTPQQAMALRGAAMLEAMLAEREATT